MSKNDKRNLPAHSRPDSWGLNQPMTRRDALKRMGVTLMGVAVATAGLPALTACAGGKSKRIILYFTGTGNCLHVARELADEDTQLLSIPQLVREGRYDLEADEIGIVYPIYGHMPPYMVRQYVQRAKLKASYRWAVLTYGARHCNAVEIWDDISRRAGTPFDYIATLIMVDNWLPNFDMNEQMRIDKHIPENLERIAADLKAQTCWHEPVTEEERQQHEGFMHWTRLDPEVGFLMRSEKFFTVTDACIGCGVCTYVCPRGNYELGARGVSTSGDCEFCFACIHACPQKAIQFIRQEPGTFPDGTEPNPQARYRNEHISLADLKMANNQRR